jgi:hypothetical protein
MALTDLQRSVCRLLARNRIASGESYVAGDAALNEWISAARVSRDIDVFHDTEEALQVTWDADRRLLEAEGFGVHVLRERRAFVEAEVRSGADGVRMEWTRDSAFRFFPLVSHDDLGLTLHPFDLATNKVLALVGRLEARDWVDVIESETRIQPLGFVAFAACGKDPGFSPASILEEAARSDRYSTEEIRDLVFADEPPNAASLSRQWKGLLDTANEVVRLLPAEEVGRCVLASSGSLCKASPDELRDSLAQGDRLIFHPGRIRGALPQILQ